MTRKRYNRIKRAVDLLVSGTILVLTAPILAVVAVAIRFSSPGPVLYRARRVGQYHAEFEMLKFRTMVINADKIGPAVTAGDDPRITKIGKLLRRTKLDELPQFWNVFRGEMSIVGPRPNVASLIEAYRGEEREILQVPQGITDFSSLWFRTQEGLLEGSENVLHDYAQNVAPIKVGLGVYYARNASLRNDWNLFWATFLAVFFKQDPMWAFPDDAKRLTFRVVEGSQAAPDASEEWARSA